MKVLITGGTGFLGLKTAERMALAGYKVTAAGRNATLKSHFLEKDIAFCQMDLHHPQEVIAACRGQDIVIHCGALSASWGRYEEFFQTNVRGTQHVIKGCFTHDVKRLIHISSPSIYFDFSDRFDIRETDPLPTQSCNAYAQTKLLAEKTIDKAFRDGLHVVTLRPRGIFGPGDTTIFPRLIEANRKHRLPLIHGGQALLDMTYVENVVDAILLSIQAPAAACGQKFNITNGEPWTALALVKCLCKKLEEPFYPKQINYTAAYAAAWGMELFSKYLRNYKEPHFTRYSIGIISKSQTLDIQAAKHILGYFPRFGMEEGIAAFAQWWKEKEKSTYGR